MALKPYFCGRCGGRFRTASKYCPACGAILSLPLGSRARAGGAPLEEGNAFDAFRRSGWMEITIIMVLLFVALYNGMRAMRERSADVVYNVVTEVRYVDVIDNTVYDRKNIVETVPADKFEDYNPQTVIYGLSPEHRKQYGDMPLDVARAMAARERTDRPAGDKDKDVDVNIKVGVDDARSARAPRAEWDSAGSLAAMLAPSPSQGREPEIQIGMSQREVMDLWGKPLSRRGPYARDGEYFERWDFGDPVYNMDVGTRYVEFGRDKRVAVVRDGGVMIRKPKEEPTRRAR